MRGEQATREREREQAAKEREREQKARQKDDDDDDDDKKKSTGFMSKLGSATKAAAVSQVGRYKTKEASIPEGVKKTPGVSKKARGAVGWAKHARKGTGAKRQFQKGVRQAGERTSKKRSPLPGAKIQ